VTVRLRLPCRVSSHKPDVLYPEALAASRELAGSSGTLASSPLWPGPQRGVAYAWAGCGSLAFSTRPPCSSIGVVFDVDAELRGASRSRAPWGRVDQRPVPHDLRFSFGDSIWLVLSVIRGALVAWSFDPAPRVRAVSGLLSWGCQISAPPSTQVPGVHSQWSRCSEELSTVAFPREVA
jgi:hypothetical protein